MPDPDRPEPSDALLWVIVGPTASGKTELALELAEKLGGEVISADSVQVYRHFELGTGKPSASERARVPHRLIDWLDPLEAVDAGRWALAADAAICELRAAGRVPIVCGGSFLWVRALLFGLAEMPSADPEVRRRHRELVENDGRAALHARLAEVDPASGARLAPNDFVRVSRALEVFELSGEPLSRLQEQHGFRARRHAARLIGVRRPPEELDLRIATRVKAMLASGWIDEVRELEARGYGAARAMGSVGYKQIHETLQSGAPFDESELEASIRRATRVFARRQRTWLRDEPVEWLEPGQLPDSFSPPPSP